MGKIDVGDIVLIIQIDGNYGNPFVGRKGEIMSRTEQDPISHFQVKVGGFDDMAEATLTLFENEVELSNGD